MVILRVWKRAPGLVNVKVDDLWYSSTEKLRKTWKEIIRTDLEKWKISKELPKDRNAWKSIIYVKANNDGQ